MESSKRRSKEREGEAPAEPQPQRPKSCGSAGASPSHEVLAALRAGTVIPAHPLALTAERQLDERRQRALSRYYIAAGAGGLAVGVHTTQFAIHYPSVGLLQPVLALAAEEMDRADANRAKPLIRVAGICGDRNQALREAALARDLAYQFGLVSLGSLRGASTGALLNHCRAIAEVIDLFGFYLQPAVGGVELPYEFWRRFCEIPNVRAIKVAAFDRYRTLTVVRAVAESGRSDIALYTGNDDNIIADLLTSYEVAVNLPNAYFPREFAGGLLGQWAAWTSVAVELHRQCRSAARGNAKAVHYLLSLGTQLTDANAAIFDAANNFRGCIPGIHEVLRRQGLLAGTWCLDENEVLSPNQSAELDRVIQAYPHLTDDDFVIQHRDDWLRG
jgi:dihydrodipicolinate synthase/N-acetylneuraminate lyase